MGHYFQNKEALVMTIWNIFNDIPYSKAQKNIFESSEKYVTLPSICSVTAMLLDHHTKRRDVNAYSIAVIQQNRWYCYLIFQNLIYVSPGNDKQLCLDHEKRHYHIAEIRYCNLLLASITITLQP